MRPELISTAIRARLGSGAGVAVADVGQVISVGDGIARVSGVESAMLGELLEFPGRLFGIALNLEEDRVGVVRWVRSPTSRKATRCGGPAASFRSPSAMRLSAAS